MPNYDIQIHQEAKANLSSLDTTHRERITNTIVEVSGYRKPSDHSKCKVLNNNPKNTLYKIRVGDFRVLLELDKPNLNVLKIGDRDNFYSEIPNIHAGM
jgi:mRNA-degrading endonuclease RelE of RelBE toxin-antitoxin system